MSKVDYLKNKKSFQSEIQSIFFLVSQVLSVRHTKQTSKNVADTTFKEGEISPRRASPPNRVSSPPYEPFSTVLGAHIWLCLAKMNTNGQKWPKNMLFGLFKKITSLVLSGIFVT